MREFVAEWAAPQHTLPDKLALLMLARNGIAAIWQLNVDAAEAYRTGHLRVAAAIVEIAEAAEKAWLRVEGVRALGLVTKPTRNPA